MISKPRIQGVTFDMDGLMFNTEDLYDQVTGIVLQRRGKKLQLPLKQKMMGLPGPQAYEILRADLQLQETYQDFHQEMEELFADLLPRRIEKMPGLDPLLELLEARQIPKGVATSSTRKFAQAALGRFDLIPRFQFVLTGEDVVHGKPHPEIYLKSAARLGIEPRRMLAIEDSWNGSRAAVAAGAFTVAVPTEHSLGQDFGHADLVVPNLGDRRLVEILAAED
jgi:HAD superfamily hydrolase (TIGR01509 family)